MASSGYALRALRLHLHGRAAAQNLIRASLKNIGNVLGSLEDRVRPDQGWRSVARPKIQHKHRTRGRDLRIHRNHANLPGSSHNALLINASRLICNMTTA
jgi:hypothetical protein